MDEREFRKMERNNSRGEQDGNEKCHVGTLQSRRNVGKSCGLRDISK
jgi:hypothetical protein